MFNAEDARKLANSYCDVGINEILKLVKINASNGRWCRVFEVESLIASIEYNLGSLESLGFTVNFERFSDGKIAYAIISW